MTSILEGNDPGVMRRRQKKFRVAEIFGPTIQGEGRNVGVPCHFIRFGGCDFRCKWCDSPHAVLPEFVNELPLMDVWSIIHQLNVLDAQVPDLAWPENKVISPNWIVLTGGNPALLDLEYLIALLHKRSQKVMVETQGSAFRPWFAEVDDLCFSPKPPSSGMDWSFEMFDRILHALWDERFARYPGTIWAPYLKVPIFTYADLDFAEEVHKRWPDLEMFLSIGNEDPSLPTVSNPHPTVLPGDNIRNTREVILDDFKSWVEVVLLRQALADCHIFPQQHVLLWGNERGH